MRKILWTQIVVFLSLFFVALALGILLAQWSFDRPFAGRYTPLAVVAAAIALTYVFALALYRIFLWIAPLREGEISEGSQQEFVYHVYLLFYLMLFYPVMRSGFVPVPVMRLFYQALGARLGANTYSSGIILDPPFVEIGSNTIVGQYALVVPHVIEGRKLAHFPIRIGNNVTIGAHACVLSGVTIGDNAIVATGAVVPKGTVIGEGETWGGVPARRLNEKDSSDV